MNRLLVFLFCFSISLQAYAKHRFNFAVGQGMITQEYSNTETEFSSLGSHVDLQYDWSNVLIGLTYNLTDTFVTKDYQDVESIWGFAPYLGFSVKDRFEVLAGMNFGRSKRILKSPPTPLTEQAMQHDGKGYFVGVRFYPLSFKYFDVGFAANYFTLKDDHYEVSTNGGDFIQVNQEAESMGYSYTLVLSFTKFTVSK